MSDAFDKRLQEIARAAQADSNVSVQANGSVVSSPVTSPTTGNLSQGFLAGLSNIAKAGQIQQLTVAQPTARVTPTGNLVSIPTNVPQDVTKFLNRADKNANVAQTPFPDTQSAIKPEAKLLPSVNELQRNALGRAQDFANTTRPFIEIAPALFVTGGLSLVTDDPIAITTAGTLTYALSKSVTNLMDRAVGLKEPITSAEEALKEIATIGAQAFIAQAGGQLIGPTITKTAELIKAAGKGVINLGAKGIKAAFQEVADVATANNIPLSLAEITGSLSLEKLSTLVDKVPFAASQIKKFRLGQLKALVNRRNQLIADQGDPIEFEKLGIQIMKQLNNFITKNTKNINGPNVKLIRDNVLKKLGADSKYITIGNDVFTIIDTSSRGVRKHSNKLFKVVANLIDKKKVVNTIKFIKISKKMLEKELQQPIAQQDAKLVKTLQEIVGTPAIGDNPAILPKLFNYQSLDLLKQKFDDVVRMNDAMFKGSGGLATTGNEVAGKYKLLSGFIRRSLDKHVEGLSNPAALKAQKEASDFWLRWVKNTFRDEKLIKMRKEVPELFNTIMFNTKDLTHLRIFKRVLGQVGFKKAKGAFFKQVIDTGDIAKELGTYRPEVLNEIITPGELNQLMKLDAAIKAPVLETVVAEQEIINNPIFKDLLSSVTKNPQLVTKAVFKPGNTTIIKFTRKVIGERNFGQLKVAFTEDLMQLNAAGFFSPREFVNKLHSFGEATLKEIYTSKELADLQSLALVASRLKGALVELNTATFGLEKRGLGGLFTKVRKSRLSSTLLDTQILQQGTAVTIDKAMGN